MHWRPREFFQRRVKIFCGATFKIDGTGTNEGAESKNIYAKSVNMLIYFTF